MLRRVIVPFVELFFVLLLVFIALYMVTASLTGEGETRSQDELHVLDVHLRVPASDGETWFEWLVSQGTSDGTSILLASGAYLPRFFTLESATLSSYDNGEGWAFGWSRTGRGDWATQDGNAVVSDGVCIPFTDARAHLRNGEHRSLFSSDDDPTAPSSALRTISTGGNDGDFTVLIGVSDSSELNETNVRILFQPREIARQTILRFGVPVIPMIESETPAHASISFVHEVLGQKVRSAGAVLTPMLAQSEFSIIATNRSISLDQWSNVLQPSIRMTTGSISMDGSVPMIFHLPDCAAFPMVYLYVLLGPSGVELSLEPPEGYL